MLTDCNSLVTVCASKTGPKPSPLDPMHPVMERSHPTSGRPATPADINRNGRPTSIGTSGRHQSECPADIIGMRSVGVEADASRGQPLQVPDGWHHAFAREAIQRPTENDIEPPLVRVLEHSRKF